ncbi:triacylglycerol lipase [Melampsora americana]|nr:triacylglycerol lipase [Melampsora americana]
MNLLRNQFITKPIHSTFSFSTQHPHHHHPTLYHQTKDTIHQTQNHPTHQQQHHPSKLDQLLRLGPVLFDPLRIPRYPIVLCHGLYGFSVRGPTSFPKFQIHYWGKLLKILRNKLGIKVIIGKVPSTGSIKQRAISLNQMLKDDLSIKHSDLNFLGHSMGGLDARYLISHLKPHLDYNPVSLTTVCTPHRGSPFMDWCRANIGVGFQESDDQFNSQESTQTLDSTLPFSLSQPILSLYPNSDRRPSQSSISKTFNYLPNNLLKVLLLNLLDSPAYSNLSTDFLINRFNPNTPNDPNVKYFSLAGQIQPKINLIHPLYLPKLILDEYEKNQTHKGHDGLVTIESAKWGEFLGIIENTDHWEIRGSSAFGKEEEDESVEQKKEREEDRRRLNSDELMNEKTKSSWLEVNKLIGSWISSNSKSTQIKSMTEDLIENDLKPHSDSDSNLNLIQSPSHQRDLKVYLEKGCSSDSSLYDLANWILKRLPILNSSQSQSQSQPQPGEQKLNFDLKSNQYKSTIHSHFPLDDLDLLPGLHSNPTNLDHSIHPPPHSNLSVSSSQRSLEEMKKFDLERLYISICRNLYDHGF